MPEVLEATSVYQAGHQKTPGTPSPESVSTPGARGGFLFKLPAFEGPLDLLLHLIKENRIDIYDIPIVQITRQYTAYLDLMQELNLEIAGEFLVMAATLIHIKSRMLLPADEEEKEEPAEDPRAELVQRLLEYRAYKESCLHLRKREDIWKDVFRRAAPDKNDIEFEPEPLLFEANVFDLISAFQRLMERAPEQAVEITREKLTVADRINYVVERLEREDGIRFEDLFEEGCTRLTLIVTFLALLELVRLGLARIYQERAFGVIWVMNPRASSGAVEEALPQDAAGHPR
ncbi:MAG: segregation/condensation protein A [Deferribacteres bacterium]|nr:segregation/condensation protein A [Deferribacteres bacterium]